MSGIYGNGVALTEKVLDYLWGRQNLTLNNIANVDTPGFKYQYVTFEEELAGRISAARKQPNSMRAVERAISNTHLTMAPSVSGTGWPVSLQYSLILDG